MPPVGVAMAVLVAWLPATTWCWELAGARAAWRPRVAPPYRAALSYPHSHPDISHLRVVSCAEVHAPSQVAERALPGGIVKMARALRRGRLRVREIDG